MALEHALVLPQKLFPPWEGAELNEHQLGAGKNSRDIEEAMRLKELGDEEASSGVNMGIKEGT